MKQQMSYVRERIRTLDLLIRSQTLYPAELPAQLISFYDTLKRRDADSRKWQFFLYILVILKTAGQLPKAASPWPVPPPGHGTGPPRDGPRRPIMCGVLSGVSLSAGTRPKSSVRPPPR